MGGGKKAEKEEEKTAKTLNPFLCSLDLQIRTCLTDMLASGADMSEPHIKEVLRQRGLVGDVLKALGYSDQPTTATPAPAILPTSHGGMESERMRACT